MSLVVSQPAEAIDQPKTAFRVLEPQTANEDLEDESPVLFLDFDGVTHPEGISSAPLFGRLPAIESVLRRHPTVRVVISSSWRLARPLDALQKLFSPSIAPRVIGKTPCIEDGQSFTRHRECLSWLSLNATVWTPWVALDDQPWLFRPSCPQLITVPWEGQGIEVDQLIELDARLREASR